MALILALIDGGSVLVVAGGALLIWAHPQLTGRIDGIATVLSQAAGFSPPAYGSRATCSGRAPSS